MARQVARGPPSTAEGPRRDDGEASKPPFVMRWLTTLTVLGCACGVVVGLLCQQLGAPEPAVKLIQLPGGLFIRALKAVVVPMIFASMVSNMAVLGETGASSRMAGLAIKFYASTTFVAAIEGIVLFNVFRFCFRPLDSAEGQHAVTAAPSATSSTILNTALSFSHDIVPENIVKALLDMQLLGVITFAMFFGTMVSKTPGGQPVIRFFGACFEALVGMVRAIILFTPLGVGSLVAHSVAQSSGLGSMARNLGTLLGVIVLGQALHAFCFYGGVYFAFTRRSPLRYFSGMVRMWIMAFGTSSSAATLPTTCSTCESLGVSRRTVDFVCPIGCTINMDGSALERPLVVLWIAHTAAQPLPLPAQLAVALVSALMSVGGSPIPSAGVSTLLLMVEAAGIALTPDVRMLVGFCLAIEWLLDSIRTSVNVTGDAVGVAVIDCLMQHEAPEGDEEAGATDNPEVATDNPEVVEVAAAEAAPPLGERDEEAIAI
eukprot:CAMPEP_0171172090 /NCGR_PEP_ID=MMETSP0790-20130122/9546_1 /TAXON_ID=2925 /ORGANISM="Alexandrium catenella, Strain OF101" /LENGTH=487 /DNA_ID=CAMNT_0011636949 /DNA_START=39 /DNA_END=1502 /DNA_ORIENTATION=+